MTTGTLLDVEHKARWFDGIWEDVSSGKIPAKQGITSIDHAHLAGYITANDRLDMVSKLAPFIKVVNIIRGYSILQGDEGTYQAITKMLGFMLLVEPVKHREQYSHFISILDDPPDNMDMNELYWNIMSWVDEFANSIGFEIGWKNGKLVFGKGDGDFDE